MGTEKYMCLCVCVCREISYPITLTLAQKGIIITNYSMNIATALKQATFGGERVVVYHLCL